MLYSLNKKRDAVARFFRLSYNRAADYAPLPAIFPGHTAPVIRASSDGEQELAYGLRASWCRRTGGHHRSWRQGHGQSVLAQPM